MRLIIIITAHTLYRIRKHFNNYVEIMPVTVIVIKVGWQNH